LLAAVLLASGSAAAAPGYTIPLPANTHEVAYCGHAIAVISAPYTLSLLDEKTGKLVRELRRGTEAAQDVSCDREGRWVTAKIATGVTASDLAMVDARGTHVLRKATAILEPIGELPGGRALAWASDKAGIDLVVIDGHTAAELARVRVRDRFWNEGLDRRAIRGDGHAFVSAEPTVARIVALP
jgi:hypothetical protein